MEPSKNFFSILPPEVTVWFSQCILRLPIIVENKMAALLQSITEEYCLGIHDIHLISHSEQHGTQHVDDLVIHCCFKIEDAHSSSPPLTIVNTHLITEIHVVECPDTKQFSISRRRHKKYPSQVGVGPCGSAEHEGRLWGKRLRLDLLCSSLQYLVPRNGHCLRAKLNLNEAKRGWCRGCGVAVPTTDRGVGGVESIGSQAIRGCHVRKGCMWQDNKVWWQSLQPHARCASHTAEPGARASTERSFIPLADFTHMFSKHVCSIGAWGFARSPVKISSSVIHPVYYSEIS